MHLITELKSGRNFSKCCGLTLRYSSVLLLLFTGRQFAAVLASPPPPEPQPDDTSDNTTTYEEEEKQDPPWRLSFRSYESPEKIISYGRNLSALNTFMTWTEIGRTQQQKNPIYLATIRNPKKKQTRAIFIDALMIGNNYQTASIACYIIDQLMFNSSYYMDILDTVTFYIVPLLNLDSYVHNYKYITDKDGHGHRPRYRGFKYMAFFEVLKNNRTGMRPPSCYAIACEPSVSIATNFPFKWDALPDQVIREFNDKPVQGHEKYIFHFNDSRSIHYRGGGPCSESECQAVVNFIKKHKEIDTYVTLQGFANLWGMPYAYKETERPENYDEMGKLAAAVTEAINEGSRETTWYGPWSHMFDLSIDNVYNGREHPGNPIDWAKSIGIRFTFWAGFGEHARPRYTPGPDVERVNRDAWKGFLVLARLKDKYGRPVFASSHPFKPNALHFILVLVVLAYV